MCFCSCTTQASFDAIFEEIRKRHSFSYTNIILVFLFWMNFHSLGLITTLQSSEMKYLAKSIKYIVIAITIAIFYVAINITIYATQSNIIASDAAITLGAGIRHDQPSPVFRERINHAVTLYKTGIVKKLIFTGGVGKDEAYAESEVARRYAINAGVPAEDILIEKVSTITHENLLEAKKILEQKNLNRVLIISDPLHMKRAMSMATDLGLNANPAPTPSSMYRTWSTQSGFLIREVYFYLHYLFYRR